jgi:serine/threonine protein kinase
MGPDSSIIGKVLGRYRIVSKVGEGGMGVVYRAHDQILRRDVALKFVGKALPQEARESLLREARAASALSHPNVCTVHEVGESDGEFYIVMELIEGQPLSVLIGSGGLPYESVMRYGVCGSEILPLPFGIYPVPFPLPK